MLEEVEYKDYGSFSGYFVVDGVSGQTISGPYEDRSDAEASICDRYEPYNGPLVDGTTYGLGWS
jgi:hypothetical protein